MLLLFIFSFVDSQGVELLFIILQTSFHKLLALFYDLLINSFLSNTQNSFNALFNFIKYKNQRQGVRTSNKVCCHPKEMIYFVRKIVRCFVFNPDLSCHREIDHTLLSEKRQHVLTILTGIFISYDYDFRMNWHKLNE